MAGDADGRVIQQAAEAAKRQAELMARHRDLTKPVPPVGSDGDSIRGVKGFEGITDQMLEERANFDLRKHMQAATSVMSAYAPSPVTDTIDLKTMTAEELHALAGAALQEFETRQKQESNG